jgi:hypothetical protein
VPLVSPRVDPQGVVRADLVWFAVLLAAAVGDWLGAWDPTVPAYLAVWLVGASISALPMYRTAVLGGFRHLGMFWRVTGPQSVRIGIDSLLARSVFVVSLAAASIIIDDEASGLLAAAVLVFSPMSVIHASSLAVVIPAQVRMGGIHVTRYRVPIAVFAAISVITIVWAAALLVFNETRFAFGPFDLDANGISTALFFATLLRFLGLAFWRGPQVSLRVADAAVESLRARMVGPAPSGAVDGGIRGRGTRRRCPLARHRHLDRSPGRLAAVPLPQEGQVTGRVFGTSRAA